MAGRTGRSLNAYRRATTLAIAAAALALGATRLEAQGARGCTGADCDGPMGVAFKRAYAVQVEQIQERLAELLRQQPDAELQLTLRRVDSVLRVVRVTELGGSRELARLQRELARAARAERDGELQSLARELASLQMRVALTEQIRTPGPAGYLGVTFSGDSKRTARRGEVFIVHGEYPAIISVEPGSPAAKAGVRPGDTLIAYNKLDVVRDGPISLSQLLQPGARVTLNVRRDGAVRALPVVVGQRPGTFVGEQNTYAYRYVVPAPAPPAPGVRVHVERAPRAPRAPEDMPELPPVPPMPGDPNPSVIFLSTAPGTSLVAGAEVTRMNADLREVFGTDRGVLVLNVAQGTPASQAGLRGGDVILSCNGTALSTPAAFTALLRARPADDRAVTLEVMRRRKTKKVVLEWDR